MTQFPGNIGIATRAIGLGLAVCGGVGCVSSRPASTATTEGATVRVAYPAPQEILVETRAGIVITIPGVRELNGVVARSVPDTLYVRVLESQRSGGSTWVVPPGSVVTIPRASRATITEDVADAKKMLLITLAVVVGLLGIIAIGLAVDPI